MFRLVLNLFYGCLWLCLIGIGLVIATIMLLICVAWPPAILIFGGILIFLTISHKKNLGVKGIQSIFPKFLHHPKGRIMGLLR